MELRKIHNVLIIGTGIMGWQIGLLFAQRRYTVVLADIKQEILDKAKTNILDNVTRRMQKGKLSEEEKNQILNRITYAIDWEKIATNQDLVIECIVENVTIKRKIFEKLSKVVKIGTICGTNSSTIGITKLVEGLPEDFTNYACNIHFSNPVLRLHLVELYSFSKNVELLGMLKRMFRAMRYETVVLKKLVNGFVMNRILSGALVELFYLMENEVATPEEIDLACTEGLNWPMGIARLADMVGLDTIYNAFKFNYEEEKDEMFRPPKVLKELVEAGRYGWKTKKGIYDYKTLEDKDID